MGADSADDARDSEQTDDRVTVRATKLSTSQIGFPVEPMGLPYWSLWARLGVIPWNLWAQSNIFRIYYLLVACAPKLQVAFKTESCDVGVWPKFIS
jgi:hypothetical protein